MRLTETNVNDNYIKFNSDSTLAGIEIKNFSSFTKNRSHSFNFDFNPTELKRSMISHLVQKISVNFPIRHSEDNFSLFYGLGWESGPGSIKMFAATFDVENYFYIRRGPLIQRTYVFGITTDQFKLTFTNMRSRDRCIPKQKIF